METWCVYMKSGTYFKLKSLHITHRLDELGGYCTCQHVHFRTCSIGWSHQVTTCTRTMESEHDSDNSHVMHMHNIPQPHGIHCSHAMHPVNAKRTHIGSYNVHTIKIGMSLFVVLEGPPWKQSAQLIATKDLPLVGGRISLCQGQTVRIRISGQDQGTAISISSQHGQVLVYMYVVCVKW